MPVKPLTPTQVTAYLDRINLPKKYYPENKPTIDLAYITALHVHHITSIPYENLSIHYSKEHDVSIEPDYLFDKIVTRGCGRGGYCMEIGLLFHRLLRSLGIRSYMAPARSRLRNEHNIPFGPYLGISHLVQIVTLPDPNNSRYALDVCYGGDGPTAPLLLDSGKVVKNLGAQEVRLVNRHLDEHVEPAGQLKSWVYEYRNGVEREWEALYSFGEYEFFVEDFGAINFGVSRDAESFQTFTVIAVMFLGKEKERSTGVEKGGDEDGYGEKEMVVVGKVMLKGAVLKRNMGGKTEVVKVCETEEERLKVIREVFGIEFTEDEKEGIKGWRTDLKG